MSFQWQYFPKIQIEIPVKERIKIPSTFGVVSMRRKYWAPKAISSALKNNKPREMEREKKSIHWNWKQNRKSTSGYGSLSTAYSQTTLKSFFLLFICCFFSFFVVSLSVFMLVVVSSFLIVDEFSIWNVFANVLLVHHWLCEALGSISFFFSLVLFCYTYRLKCHTQWNTHHWHSSNKDVSK